MREYRFSDGYKPHSHAYLLAPVLTAARQARPSRILDLGCGSGNATAALAEVAPVVGLDTSATGIAVARRAYPALEFHRASVYDRDLVERFGRFPLVVSLEVVEHLYDPRLFARNAFDLLEAGGIAVISTPYHGYIKNVALALGGKMDAHYSALWDGGHIKFWSVKTLSALLVECGFEPPRFMRAGRIAPLAKSMIAVARRPS